MSEHEAGPERAPLGSALRAAREARGLGVADVARAVNLRETVVRAIERDDFALCGGDVYARGHLRAYARQVGLAEQPLLDAFAEQHGTRTASRPGPAAPAAPSSQRRPVPVAPLRGRKRPDDVPLERAGPNWALLAGAALAVVVVFLLVQLVSDLRAPGRATSEVAAPVTTSSATPSAPAPSSSPRPTPPATSSTSSPPSSTPSSAPAANGVAVALRVTGDSWVSVRDAAGRTVFSGLLSKGDARRFTDGKVLRLTLGNAGAVQLTVNGKPLGSAGGDGQVVRLQFGPGDPA